MLGVEPRRKENEKDIGQQEKQEENGEIVGSVENRDTCHGNAE